VVQKGDKGEYGPATLELNGGPDTPLFAGIRDNQQIWMKSYATWWSSCPRLLEHWKLPGPAAWLPWPLPCAASTACSSTPRWSTPQRASAFLANFVFDICGCVKDWDPRHRVPLVEDQIRRTGGATATCSSS